LGEALAKPYWVILPYRFDMGLAIVSATNPQMG